MKSAIFILLFLFGFSLNINCQNDSINNYDQKNRKQGYWIHYYPESNDQVKKKEGYYLDDLKVKTWISYYPDGKTVKTKGQYKDGTVKVSYEKFYENGKLKEEGDFFNKKYHGNRIKYYENGNIEQLAHFDDNGVQFDTTFNFYSSGEIKSKRVHDTTNHVITDISYSKEGEYIETKMVVLENQNSFSILQIAPNLPLDSLNDIEGNYHYKLTFENTPIFREFLFVVHQDSTYEVFKYIYESCYNYIMYSKGTWTYNDKRIHLSNNELIPSEFTKKDDLFISKEVKDIAGKNRVFCFKKVTP